MYGNISINGITILLNRGDNMSKIENVQPLRTAEEIKNMREALAQTNAAERNLLLFNIGINTGLRIGDIVGLRIEDVKGRSNVIIREGKTRKKRTVYLDAVMVDIADYLEGKDGQGWLFPSRKGDNHISTTQAYRILAGAGERCGYDYVGSHTLRKTFGRFYYDQTKDVATLMEIFNHDSQADTKRYIGIRADEIEASLKDFRI